IQGGGDEPTVQTWPSVPLNPAGFVNKAWCPEQTDLSTDFNCQNVDLFGNSIFADVLIDMFWLDEETIAKLNETFLTICYISGGTYEVGRPDSINFAPESLGLTLGDWPDEMYIDIRPDQPHYASLQEIMLKRAQLAKEKGCQAIEWDNVDSWQAEAIEGIPAQDAEMYQNQLIWNKYLAQITHDNNMAVGLKNDVAQIPELVDYFDFAVNERCFDFNECDTLLPFVEQGKGVLLAIYQFDGLNVTEVCDYAYEHSMMSLIEYRGDWWPCAMHDAVNGGWSEWSECTHPCGTGVQERVCNDPVSQNNGARCTGASRRACNALPCEYCKDSNITTPIECLNGGVCYIAEVAESDTSACVCPPDFTGERCENTVSDLYPCVYAYDVANATTELLGGTCENLGTCDPTLETNETFFKSHYLSSGLIKNHANYTYTTRCVCPPYWAGPSCETKSQCADAYSEGAADDTPKCYHGRCVYLPSYNTDTTICECDEGYVGDLCDISDPCLKENACLNDGLCAYDPTLVGWGMCTCKDGFLGRSCELSGNYTIQCEQGGVALFNIYEGEYCFCHPWSTGDNCEIPVIDGPCDQGVCPAEAVCTYKSTTEEYGSVLEFVNGTAATPSMSTFVTCTCQYPYGNDDYFSCTYIADIVSETQPLPSTFSLLTECGTATLTLTDNGTAVMMDANGIIYSTYGAAAGIPPYNLKISPMGIVSVYDSNSTHQWSYPFAGAPVEEGPYVFQLTSDGDAIVRPFVNEKVLFSLGTQTPSYCENGNPVTPNTTTNGNASVVASSDAVSSPASISTQAAAPVSLPATAISSAGIDSLSSSTQAAPLLPATDSPAASAAMTSAIQTAISASIPAAATNPVPSESGISATQAAPLSTATSVVVPTALVSNVSRHIG
ncbi:hypothetical protein SARC_01832, partial [Sphaeroforma arctica JP610]